jgi:hypothetical protein
LNWVLIISLIASFHFIRGYVSSKEYSKGKAFLAGATYMSLATTIALAAMQLFQQSNGESINFSWGLIALVIVNPLLAGVGCAYPYIK